MLNFRVIFVSRELQPEKITFRCWRPTNPAKQLVKWLRNMQLIILTLRYFVGVTKSPLLIEKCAFLRVIFEFRYSLRKLFLDARCLPTGLKSQRRALLVGLVERSRVSEKLCIFKRNSCILTLLQPEKIIFQPWRPTNRVKNVAKRLRNVKKTCRDRQMPANNGKMCFFKRNSFF